MAGVVGYDIYRYMIAACRAGSTVVQRRDARDETETVRQVYVCAVCMTIANCFARRRKFLPIIHFQHRTPLMRWKHGMCATTARAPPPPSPLIGYCLLDTDHTPWLKIGNVAVTRVPN